MKTIPIFLLSVCALFFTIDANSQVGIRLGVHSFELNSPKDIFSPGSANIRFKEAKLGFQVGIFGKIPLGGLFVESRLMFHSTSVEYSLDGENGSAIGLIKEERFSNLDVPVLIGFKVLFFDLFTGPVAHIHLNSISELFELDNYDAKFDTATFGWRFGMGAGLGNLLIGLEYETNFSNFGEHITIGNQDFSFGDTPNRLILNLGYKI